ncbi:MAG: hypothetical protein ACLFQA_00165 [Bacteroidales bacterium]
MKKLIASIAVVLFIIGCEPLDPVEPNYDGHRRESGSYTLPDSTKTKP